MSGRAIRVGLTAGPELWPRLRAALGSEFELKDGESDPADVRLVVLEWIEDERTRGRGQGTGPGRPPTVALLPAGAEAVRVRACLRQGASEIVFTDEIEEELAAALRRAVEGARARRSEAVLDGGTSPASGSRARRLADALDRLRGAYDETLAALVAALDSRERETACHSQRVAAFAVLLGVRVGLVGEALEDLYRGALLHDIGKIGIPDAILLKRGELDPDEWKVMREHPAIGARVLAGISFLKGALEVPLTHHEAWNGGGYPQGLRGEEIPLSSRIFAVVDTYDALRSERPYKAPMAHEEALAILERVSGERLDPALVEIFRAEPESSWDRLGRAAEESGAFRHALEVCRNELGADRRNDVRSPQSSYGASPRR